MPRSGEPLPPAAWSGDAGVFDSYLADSGQDYVLVGTPQQVLVTLWLLISCLGSSLQEFYMNLFLRHLYRNT